MRSKFTMKISICQAENGLSLDDLIKKSADGFENKAFAGILKMNLQLTQRRMQRFQNNSSNQKCCQDDHFTRNDSFECRIRTSPDESKMDLWHAAVQSSAKFLLHWQSSSDWNAIKPQAMSLKSC